jgi:excinuclease UvrABC nuclease subunit
MNNPVYEKLRSIAKKFPNTPGVYFWRNEKGQPIYIGRAGSLKKRIANYFTSKVDPRIREMTEAAHTLDFETTDTLLEAIVLEANLIKQHWPKYNILEKDGKSFIYLVVTDEEFPRLLFVRGRELQRYETGKIKTLAIFGPYQSYYLLRKALEIVRKIFPYSNCKPGQLKPCFHNQIGLCPGVCVGLVDAKAYHDNIRNIILFFRGDKKALLKKLQRDNPDAIKALRQVRDTALLADSDVLLRGNQLTDRRIEGYDISHSGGKNPVGAMVVFENGEADPGQYRLFNIKEADTQDDLAMLEEVIERRLRHSEWPLPQIVFVDGGASQVKRVNTIFKKYGHLLPIVGLSKAGKHAASAASGDKFVIANVKKTGKELILASRNLFQQVRNESHRFAIRAQRQRSRRSFLK